MLIGGMFDIDVENALKEPEKKEFRFACDTDGQYTEMRFTNNGRTATVLALADGLCPEADDEILIPEYTCISVINALEAVPVSFRVYRVGENLTIDRKDLESKITEKTKAIYVIHYFGIPQPKETVLWLREIADTHGLAIVEDLTQSLFSRGIGFGDYIVSSTRKWFPMTDGGVAAVKKGNSFRKRKLLPAYDEAAYTQMFLAVARKHYGTAEHAADGYPAVEVLANSKRYLDFTPRGMTKLSENIFFAADLETLCRKRRENYNTLYDGLCGIPGIRIFGDRLREGDGIVPFGFQMVAENRDALKAYLISRGIIPELQWVLPDGYYLPSPYAEHMSKNSLMLQCDQRYGSEHMEYVCETVRKGVSEKRNV